ncbi:MAG TPA: hypothetical protein DEQ38_07085 [Elusimicrobia bacterium]|nr:MAG: hypothetical protein A2089_07950 [Elusimicrobia bacterium GWD2_63_28]HCC47864.1 hypothetical protein [Elusimicrobiota bacterium]
MKIIALLLLAALPAAAAPKYAPADGHTAAPLWSDSAYLKKAAAPDYWNLSSFYMPQRKGWSVGAASLSMAFNALFSAGRERGDEDENFDPQRLVELSSAASHGLTLTALAGAARDLLAACGLRGEALATELPDASAQSLKIFRAALAANERDPRDVMLLHFTQDTVTGAPGGPFAHISPVGAYDAKTRRVLVLDTDRKWYEPYWAADEQVLKAVTAVTPKYGRGGFVVIRRAR